MSDRNFSRRRRGGMRFRPSGGFNQNQKPDRNATEARAEATGEKKPEGVFERARHDFYSVVGGKNPFVLGSVVRSRGFRPFYRVRLPAQNRPEAEKLCAALEAAGGACVVLRS